MEYERFWAARTELMPESPIRGLLRQRVKYGFGGGYPSPETFPSRKRLIELFSSLLDEDYEDVLQYRETEGFLKLRQALPTFLKRRGIDTEIDNILPTTGSQQALSLLAEVLIDPNDIVAVESPTYLGAIQAFKPKMAEFVEIETDENGVTVESVEKILDNPELKFLYLIPSFQNPSGRTISLERRKKIAELVKDHEALIIEDDPYSELRYFGESLPSLYSLAPDNVIHLGTFSKTFVPGVRVGFVVGNSEVIQMLTRAKQGADLFTSNITQGLAAEYLNTGDLDKDLGRKLSLYRSRLETMEDALSNFFPEGTEITNPEGGMFFWAVLPEAYSELDIVEVLKLSQNHQVAFVPGKDFFVNGNRELRNRAIRLNFTQLKEDDITEGLQILGSIFKYTLRKGFSTASRSRV